MASDQSSLYGQARAKSKGTSDLSSSSNLAFSSQLSSLIAQGSNPSANARPRPSKTAKTDIFGKQNKGAQKRAAADLEEGDHHDSQQKHKRSQDIGSVDDATLNRSKRRMQEKVRIYNDMKKGLYLAGDSSGEEDTYAGSGSSRQEDYLARLRRKEKEGLVDFDRKWADEERKRAERSDESEEDDDNASIISYEDEFGRTRRGTRAEAARAARTKEEEENRDRAPQERWRPSRPENLIYGEAIQTEAFNPDAKIASQMADLAARRDRSPTPEHVHYDAEAEVRNRGTGFYAFSQDETERLRQMEDLKNARKETEQEREKRVRLAAEWQAHLQDRRQQIQELRAQRQADEFLGDLSIPAPTITDGH
ncbi:hypothetical protein N7462_009628 [Penicillium macrosclerotiorum]|uniref:uncharacterized protein n=1 Tax=Penicillium macrosclerotiorum TaxID=303699 RepID=UPI002547D75D|nr:uncharacterized protein N7462_009628 [Penicillium macrosclerotiorum]KAJ5674189.1 hypothetical protein N7462_009628 [Penicillium macrosclerotiorum]